MPEELLDVPHEWCLVDADERDGLAIDAGPARPADAVDVILGHHRELEVDDVRQRVDVDAAGGEVRRHEDRDAAGLEVAERAHSL